MGGNSRPWGSSALLVIKAHQQVVLKTFIRSRGDCLMGVQSSALSEAPRGQKSQNLPTLFTSLRWRSSMTREGLMGKRGKRPSPSRDGDGRLPLFPHDMPILRRLFRLHVRSCIGSPAQHIVEHACDKHTDVVGDVGTVQQVRTAAWGETTSVPLVRVGTIIGTSAYPSLIPG